MTPTVQFAYDNNTLSGCPSDAPPSQTDPYPKGRRTSMCDGSGGTSWIHDTMGRITSERRSISAVQGNYDTDSYNLDGSIASMTVLGYSVAYSYNGAGRAISASNSADPFTYVVSAHYAPFGALASASMGPKPISISNAYNNRLQPLLISASATSTILSLCYDFHSGINLSSGPCSFSAYTSGDNGNVFQIVNNRTANRTQNFLYDSLNRIQQAYTNGAIWGETYSANTSNPGVPPATPGIDAWGNLTNRSGVTGKGTYEPLGCPADKQNHLTACSLAYDAAGNVMANGNTGYSYDGENRLISTAGMTYLYDGDGQRVEKCTAGTTLGTCATNATGTLYWTGIGSDALAETNLAGNVLEHYIFFAGRRIARREPGTTPAYHFYFSDHLGTHSLVTDANGTMPPQYESDFYPYGGEIPVTTGDSNHYKFTSKERDAETCGTSCLDYFGARHDASSFGRFMSPDPLYMEAHRLADPQRLSLYAYARNNPITLTDPTGLDVTLKCDTRENCQQAVQDFNNRKNPQFKVELGKDGKLHVVKGSVAKNLSKAEGALLGAINDTQKHATVNVVGNTGDASFGVHDSKGVNTVDLENLSQLDAASNKGGLNSGDALAHEALDAYYSLSMGEEAADQAAAGLYPGVYGPTGNENIPNQFNTAIVGSIYNQAITNGSGTERVSIRYITPIPAIDLFGKTKAQRQEIADEAGSRVTGVTFVPPKQQ